MEQSSTLHPRGNAAMMMASASGVIAIVTMGLSKPISQLTEGAHRPLWSTADQCAEKS
jgi:hypothetical protein